nr:hypothetical protein [Tanacetum cinerariifolium]
KKITIQGSDVAMFDKSNVECFNCHKMGHFTRECKAPRSQYKGRRDNFRQGSKDMSWIGLPEFEDDTVTDYSRPSPTIESTSDDVQNRNTSVTKTKPSLSTISPKPFIKFVKATDRSTKTKTAKVETDKPTVKYAAMETPRIILMIKAIGTVVSLGT